MRGWHLRHMAWIIAAMPRRVFGPPCPTYPGGSARLSRLIYRLGIIHWHLREAVKPP